MRKNANVIAVAVSKSSNTPGAFTLAWHPPAAWFNKLSAAYRASRRTQPIFDTLGYIPHPADSAERPWTKHPGASGIALGDYATLMSTLTTAFRGTAQPVPGQGTTKIWYLAQGFQTAPDPGRTGFTGTETDPNPVPSWSAQEAADQGSGPGVDQAVQLQDAIRVAYCQPAVGAYFNFHLYDERDLAGWQSGVFWPDGQPKAAWTGAEERHRRRQLALDQLRLVRRRHSAPAGGGGDAGAAEVRDHGPARKLGRGLRRHAHLAR